jgi:hypothetical protein
MWVALHKFVIFDFDLELANIGLGTLSFFSIIFLLTSFSGLHAYSRAVG